MDIEQIHPSPNPLPHLHHRKVELQSPLDLVYLRGNVAAAAKEKLDLHFPPNATTRRDTKKGRGEEEAERNEDEDPMRARVATLVNQFLDRTFDLAAPSISINGNDVVVGGGGGGGRGGDNALPTDANTVILSSVLLHGSRSSHPVADVNNNAAACASSSSLTTKAKAKATSSSTSPPTARSEPSNPQRQQKQQHDDENENDEREGIHFTYAAYDSRLSSQLASLYADLERETLAVSQLRRSAPAAGARAYGEALISGIEADIAEEDEKGAAAAGGGGKEKAEDIGIMDEESGDGFLKLEPLPDGWRDDVIETYDRGLRDLRRLGGVTGGIPGAGGDTWQSGEGGASLTETVGKVQRARDVAMEFE